MLMYIASPAGDEEVRVGIPAGRRDPTLAHTPTHVWSRPDLGADQDEGRSTGGLSKASHPAFGSRCKRGPIREWTSRKLSPRQIHRRPQPVDRHHVDSIVVVVGAAAGREHHSRQEARAE